MNELLIDTGGLLKQNGLFTYTIDSITETDTETNAREELFTWAYDGSPVQNCTVMGIKAVADYNTVKAEAQVLVPRFRMHVKTHLIASFRQ